MNMNMMGTLDRSRGDIEPGTHSETTEVLLSLLSQNKALGGKKIYYFCQIFLLGFLICFATEIVKNPAKRKK